jgi:hypothetical protein
MESPESDNTRSTTRRDQHLPLQTGNHSRITRYTALILKLLNCIRLRRESTRNQSNWIPQPSNSLASQSHRDQVRNTQSTMAIHPSTTPLYQNTQTRTQHAMPLKPSSKMSFKLSSKPSITITFLGQASETSTYSTLDAIKGTANIAVKNDTSFEDVEIALVGNVTTMVDAAGRSGTMVGGESRATQQLLKVTQPLDWQELGLESKMLRGGYVYEIPFTFVVPTQLSSRACTHRVANAAVRDAHLALPPTMGDRKSLSKMITPADFAPQGIQIDYAIEVKMTGSRKTLGKASQKIRIVPAVDEEPPLSPDEDKPYILRKEKTLKKSMFSSKVGRLAVSASQPSSFKLPASDEVEYDPTTYVRLSLRFDPATAEAKPPSLGSLASKLLITTSYSTTSRTTLQYKVRNDGQNFADITSDSLTDELNLSSMALGSSTQWTQHGADSRPNSVISMASSVCEAIKDESVISPTKSFNSNLPFYTASLLIPVSLPLASKKHVWLPTFHSCLVSRTYAFQLVLSTTGSSTSASSKVELIVPVQFSRRYSSRAQAVLELARTQVEAAMEAEEAFIARSTLVASSPVDAGIRRVGFPTVIGESRENASERPPEYAMLMGRDDGRVRTNGHSRL